jgi:low temperature requirement protein LtrA
VARFAYTYIHLLLVGGIILAAVGDELVLAHPGGHVGAKTTLAVVGGPALYVAGNLLFKYAISGRWLLSHLIGIGLLALIAVASIVANPAILSLASFAALVAVAVLETRLSRKDDVQV